MAGKGSGISNCPPYQWKQISELCYVSIYIFYFIYTSNTNLLIRIVCKSIKRLITYCLNLCIKYIYIICEKHEEKKSSGNFYQFVYEVGPFSTKKRMVKWAFLFGKFFFFYNYKKLRVQKTNNMMRQIGLHLAIWI